MQTLCKIYQNGNIQIRENPCSGISYSVKPNHMPAGIYLLKGNNRNTRTEYEVCSKLTTKTPERRR